MGDENSTQIANLDVDPSTLNSTEIHLVVLVMKNAE
jgi:hypothetical protein